MLSESNQDGVNMMIALVQLGSCRQGVMHADD